VFKRLIQGVLGKGSAAPLEATARQTKEDAKQMLDAFVAEGLALTPAWNTDYHQLPAARIIAAADPHAKAALVGLVARRLIDLSSRLAAIVSMTSADKRFREASALQDLLILLLKPKLPIDVETLEELIQCAGARSSWVRIPSAGIVRTVERFIETASLSEEHRAKLLGLKKRLLRDGDANARKLCKRIDALIAAASGPDAETGVELVPGDAWADAALEDLEKADPPHRAAWQRLLNHAAAANGSKPSAKWLKSAAALIDAIGREPFEQRLAAWLPKVGQPGLGNVMRGSTSRVDPTVMSDHNADVLKGIIWATAAIDETKLTPLVGDVAEACFKKIPSHGARCPKVANACLAALALMKGPEPVAQLSRIQAKAKKPSAQKLIEKAMARSAEQQGMSPEELEEMGVPDFGLDLAGRRAIPVGAWTAEIEVTPARDVDLRWRKAGATKGQASVPADVKSSHADALKDVKRLVKDIDRILPTRVARIERLLLDDRVWPLDVWRSRYLEHPLIAPFVRRLIWQLDGDRPRTFIHSGEGFVDASDKRVDLPSAQIRLWHPIRSSPDDVLAWRRWLESHSVTQPFKQAHREVYVLTDAERQTRTYSNRFAGHILRQHQFHALCGARGWSYHLQGSFDSHNIPTRILRRQGMRAEFWVDAIDTQVSEVGIFLHVSTDQVRFYGGESEQEPMALERVAPHVFSELMRDVDLFVGVCSVGNDPTWHDRGEQFGEYWHGYTFGELGESAKTRRDVLSRLLPRLKIADRASLSERFLVVRGDLRTYKIHLGSSNIQMEPNNQYLCIVPDRKNVGDDVFLPFEGDQTLAVILSKAFMLADDRNIKDSSIVSQIRAQR
jgi:hypothetical protein